MLAPHKRQAPTPSQSGEPYASAPAGVVQTQTCLLDLHDDLLGMVYARLDNKLSKQAFRHTSSATHRSQSINAQLTKCTLDSDVALKALACFPPHAALKEVHLNLNSPSSTPLVGPLDELLLQAIMRKHVCDRLRTVDVIHFKGSSHCTATSSAARSLLLLFPRLLTDKVLLSFQFCNLDAGFFEVMAEAPGLQELHVLRCNTPDFSVFSKLPLACLKLDPESGDTRLAGLSGLQHTLEHLELRFMFPEDLHVVLPLLHNLRTLVLRMVDLSMLPSDAQLSSNHVRTLVLNSTFHLDFESFLRLFPALRCVEVHWLNFDAVLVGDPEDACVMDVIRGLKDMAAQLTALQTYGISVKMCDRGSRFAFDCLSGCFDIDHAGMLEALLPLKEQFGSVRVLEIDMAVCNDALPMLSALFHNVLSLKLEDCSSDLDLSYLLRSMSKLEHLEISAQYNEIPEGAFCVLVSAGLCLRPFTLVLVGDNCGVGIKEALGAIDCQWQGMAHMFPCVSLEVRL